MPDPDSSQSVTRSLWPGAVTAAVTILGVAFLFLFLGQSYDDAPTPNESGVPQQTTPVTLTPSLDGGVGRDVSTNGNRAPGIPVVEPGVVPPPHDTLVPPVADEGPKQTFEPAARPRTLDAPRDGEAVVPDPVEATIAPAAVRAAVVEIRSELRGCFRELLWTEPTAEGRVTLEFTIVNEDGVGRVAISSVNGDGTTLHEDGLHDCLSEAVGALEVDVAPGFVATRVTYPMWFYPVTDPP